MKNDYFLTSDIKKATVMLVMRADNTPGLPYEALAYDKCFDCQYPIYYNKINKAARNIPKICNECFERHSGITVIQLALSNPEEAEKAMKKVIREVRKARKLYA